MVTRKMTDDEMRRFSAKQYRMALRRHERFTGAWDECPFCRAVMESKDLEAFAYQWKDGITTDPSDLPFKEECFIALSKVFLYRCPNCGREVGGNALGAR